MDRQRKSSTLRRSSGSSSTKSSSNTSGNIRRRSAPTDRIGMMIMEANEIATYLQKPYEFSRPDDDVTDSDDDVSITITNTSRHLCCTWSLDKLKQRMVKMRPLMYAAESELSSLDEEAVFFDPADTWITTAQPTGPPSPSTDNTHQDTNQNRNSAAKERPPPPSHPVATQGGSTCGGAELPATSAMLLPLDGCSDGVACGSSSTLAHSQPVLDSTAHGGLPFSTHTSEPTARRKGFSTVDCSTQTIQSSAANEQTLSMVDMCSHLVSLIQTRASSTENEGTLSDHLLSECESLKRAVVNILEMYTQMTDVAEYLEENTFLDCYTIRINSVQLVSALKGLHHSVAQLSPAHSDEEQSMNKVVRKIIEGIDVFLKACKARDDDTIHNTSSQLLDLLYELCKLTGSHVLLASLPPPVCLGESNKQTLDQLMTLETKDDTLYCKVSLDMKQAFLSGGDDVIADVLSKSDASIVRNHDNIQSMQQNFTSGSKSDNDIMKQLLYTISTTKELLLQVKYIQHCLGATMTCDDLVDPECYLVSYWTRNQGVLDEVGGIISNLQLLVKAVENIDSEDSTRAVLTTYDIRKLSRCVQIVKQSVNKLIRACSLPDNYPLRTNHLQRRDSDHDSINTYLSDNTSSISAHQLTLTDTKALDQSGEDVLETIERLTELLHTHPAHNVSPTAGASKRMLPAVPGCVVARAHATFTRGNSDGYLITTPRPSTANPTRHTRDKIKNNRERVIPGRKFSTEA